MSQFFPETSHLHLIRTWCKKCIKCRAHLSRPWLLNWRTAVRIRTSKALKSDRGALSDLNLNLHNACIGRKPSICVEDLFILVCSDIYGVQMWKRPFFRDFFLFWVFKRNLIFMYFGPFPNFPGPRDFSLC